MADMDECRHWVVVSDLHCGCQLGLCPPSSIRLDNGGTYTPSIIQEKVWGMWKEFWEEWVPRVARSNPIGVVVNGDALDGRHHQTSTTISNNLAIQRKIAADVLAPIAEKCEGRLYIIRGTPAHVGESAEDEETLARELEAIPNEYGQFSRNELWKRIGKGLVHFTHHVGTTSSAAYESTAVYKEMVEQFVEAGRWGLEPPDIVVRSHRHRALEIRVPTKNGYGIAMVTAGWQLRTPFTFKIAARNTQPQLGGAMIVQGDEDLYVRSQVWTIQRERVE